MGIAAYNRGTKALSEAIDRETARSSAAHILDRLNAVPKRPGAPAPWGPIRFVPGHGGWWAECPVTGFGYWYRTLTKAVAAWSVTITGVTRCGGEIAYEGTP